jgi:hypothetical protein
MKCLVKTGHDPSRRERCDRWRCALPTTREITPSRQSIRPYPTGTLLVIHSRHFMPGYPQLVPPGLNSSEEVFTFPRKMRTQ